MRVSVSCIGVVALALAAAGSARAEVVADAGAVRAEVRPDPWLLTLRDADGTRPLSEYPATGTGPSGTLGFRTRGGGWHHATRVISQRERGGAYTAVLATNDSLRTIRLRLAPDGAGVIALRARIQGPAAGIDAMGMGFRAPRGRRYVGFGERSNAVDQRGNVVEDYAGEGPYQPNERPFIPAFVPAGGSGPEATPPISRCRGSCQARRPAPPDDRSPPAPWACSSADRGRATSGSERIDPTPGASR